MTEQLQLAFGPPRLERPFRIEPKHDERELDGEILGLREGQWDEGGLNKIGWELIASPLLCGVERPVVKVYGEALIERRKAEGRTRAQAAKRERARESIPF